MDVVVSEEVVEKAKKIIRDELELGFYPADQWYTLADRWDLHLWISYNTGKRMASIYPVRPDGRTLTHDSSVDLDVFHRYRPLAFRQWECPDCGKLYLDVVLPEDYTLCEKINILQGELQNE